jgi:hypothetical protein
MELKNEQVLKCDMVCCEDLLENIEVVILNRPKTPNTAQWEIFGKELASRSSCLIFLWSSISESPYPAFLNILRSSLKTYPEKTVIMLNIVNLVSKVIGYKTRI